MSKNIYRRWGEHKRTSFNPSSKEYYYPLHNAMRKYGVEQFSFEIIEKCNESLLKEREKYWIDYYNSVNTGYNLTLGGEMSCLIGEKHPGAKLTQADVIFCRQEYAKGGHSKDICNLYFSDIITYSGFQNMWHGRSWRNIMPEVFKNNLHPRQKITKEDILDIRTKYLNGIPIKEIDKIYQGKYSHATISRTINKKDFYPDLWPEIEDNHLTLNKKITDDDVRLIKQLKSQGYLHKDIRKALNNKISVTTISDIVTGKRYQDIQ